jgi:hypothetical protein
MSNPYEDAVDAVFNKSPASFEDTVGNILADKLRERIGVEKVAIAQNFLNEPEPQEYQDQEGAADEEI